jgi:hypothetical protein
LIEPPTTRAPTFFSTGIASPVSMDSSTLLAPLSTTPSHRHSLSGTHAQAIVDPRVLERDVAFHAVAGYAMRDFGRQSEQRPYCAAGSFSCL